MSKIFEIRYGLDQATQSYTSCPSLSQKLASTTEFAEMKESSDVRVVVIDLSEAFSIAQSKGQLNENDAHEYRDAVARRRRESDFSFTTDVNEESNNPFKSLKTMLGKKS